MKTIETKAGFLVPANGHTNVQMRLAAGRVSLVSQPPEDPERLDVARFAFALGLSLFGAFCGDFDANRDGHQIPLIVCLRSRLFE